MLTALAAASEFKDPPKSEFVNDAQPDVEQQRHMLELAMQYLSRTMPKLPNFFATRVTVHYQDTPEHYDETGTRKIDYEPLHLVRTSEATVLYRKGSEIVEAERKKTQTSETPSSESRVAGLTTKGTFGPILGAVSDAVGIPGGVTWSHWEKSEGGKIAIFRYAVPQEKSRFRVEYCCLLEGNGATPDEHLSGYHGKIAIDPENGTIVRLTLEADLEPNLPIVRSGIVVAYGPVEIGGGKFICPQWKSISVSRSRTVEVLTGFSDDFRIYGPYSTMLNDATFGTTCFMARHGCCRDLSRRRRRTNAMADNSGGDELSRHTECFPGMSEISL